MGVYIDGASHPGAAPLVFPDKVLGIRDPLARAQWPSKADGAGQRSRLQIGRIAETDRRRGVCSGIFDQDGVVPIAKSSVVALCSMSRCVPLLLFAGLLPALVAGPVQAQSPRSPNLFYLKFGQGISDVVGDERGRLGVSEVYDREKFAETDNVPYALVAELGYRFSPSLSFGLGYQFGSYYVRDVGHESLHTVQLLGRYKMGARAWSVAPYLDVGISASTGRRRVGYGPSLGVGLDVAVNDQVSFFLESRSNLVFSETSVDPDESGSVPFDILNVTPAIGADIALRSTPTAPQVRQIDGPTEVQVGELVTFTATTNKEQVTRPIERKWMLGNGKSDTGLTALHSFEKAGTHTLLFKVENEAGRDAESFTVQVTDTTSRSLQPPSMQIAPRPATVGRKVLFRAGANGNRSVSYEWDFGDGTNALDALASHTYEEPGEYTVELTVSNEGESRSRSIPLHVDRAATDSSQVDSVGTHSPEPDSAGTALSETENVGADSKAEPYTIQIGSFSERDNARRKAAHVLFDGYPVRIQTITRETQILYRVWAGRFQRKEEARRHLSNFHEYAPDAFVQNTKSAPHPAPEEPSASRAAQQ